MTKEVRCVIEQSLSPMTRTGWISSKPGRMDNVSATLAQGSKLRDVAFLDLVWCHSWGSWVKISAPETSVIFGNSINLHIRSI